jgi:hypothetical protein
MTAAAMSRTSTADVRFAPMTATSSQNACVGVDQTAIADRNTTLVRELRFGELW